MKSEMSVKYGLVYSVSTTYSTAPEITKKIYKG